MKRAYPCDKPFFVQKSIVLTVPFMVHVVCYIKGVKERGDDNY